MKDNVRKMILLFLFAVFILTVSQSAFGEYGIDGQKEAWEFENRMGPWGFGNPTWSSEGGTVNYPQSDGLGINSMSNYTGGDINFVSDGDIMTMNIPTYGSGTTGCYTAGMWSGTHPFGSPYWVDPNEGYTIEWRIRCERDQGELYIGIYDGIKTFGVYITPDRMTAGSGEWNFVEDINEWHNYRLVVLGDDPNDSNVSKANWYQDGKLLLEEIVGGDYISSRILWHGVGWGYLTGKFHYDYVRVDTSGAYIPVPEKCGDVGTLFNDSDINRDCIGNLKDFAIIGDGWMRCTDPAGAGCENIPWIYEDFSAYVWNPTDADQYAMKEETTNGWEVTLNGQGGYEGVGTVYSASYNPNIAARLYGVPFIPIPGFEFGADVAMKRDVQNTGSVSFSYSNGYSPDYGGKVILHNKDYTNDILTLNFGTAWSGSAWRAFVRSGSTDIELPSDLISTSGGFVDVSFDFDATGISNIDVRSDVQPWNHADVTSIAFGSVPPGGVQQIIFVGGTGKDPFTPADTNFYAGELLFSRENGIAIDTVKSNCGDLGVGYLDSDIYPSGSPDCYVDANDLGVLAGEWLEDTTPIIPDPTPLPIIPKGTVTVDGDVSEWSTATWAAANEHHSDYPNDVNSQFALRWDDGTNRLYMAVVVEDTNHYFTDAYSYWYWYDDANASDRLEVFCQADDEGGGVYDAHVEYAPQYGWFRDTNPTFARAQQYAVGPDTGSGSWSSWGDGDTNLSGVFESAVDVNGSTITYEVCVTPYDNYAGKGGAGSTEITTLTAGDVVRFDLVVGTRWSDANALNIGQTKPSVLPHGSKMFIDGAFRRYELGN